jgi:hypothetical protein
MKEKAACFFVRSIATGMLLAIAISPVFAQSQSQNGQIEGTVSDINKAVIPNAKISVTNKATGATRSTSTDDRGVYRFPILPLGPYRLTAEAENFRSIVRDGITLATGQTATVDFNLSPGEIRDVVTISGDASIADAGKTDLSRVMNSQEVESVPQVTRNPYNYAFVQANVTGRPARGFPFTTINANGYLRRTNFLLDGNTNTQGDRGALRFVLLSETYVSEVQLLTNGFAAEFGNTPGLIMNVITPSGTNNIHGSINFSFRTPSFYSRPFGFSAATLPDNNTNIFSAAIGGPIIKDRWHFYFGYERQDREDKAAAPRLLTIRPENRDALIAAGLPASIFPAVIPSVESGSFYILRTDLQLNDSNRVTLRYNHSDVNSENLILGGLNTLDKGVDGPNEDHAVAVQLASYTQSFVNEFRFQYAQRVGTGGIGRRNEFSGTGPSVTIANIANFGSPEGVDTVFLPRRITQLQDNLTRIIGSHIVKLGGGITRYDHSERASIFSRYTFSSIAQYNNARNGSTPGIYSFYDETFGDPEINYKAAYWNGFLQDDWKATPRLKLTYGLRYDLYQIPKADLTSPFSASQKFNVDKNNFSPRIGVAYSLREGKFPTVFRAGAGIYYDQPLLAMYQRALINNGTKFFSFRISPSTLGAPVFPNALGLVPTSVMSNPRNIDTVAPDFENMYAIHSNIQVEQTITEELSLAIGFVHSGGRHLPIYRNINCLPVGGALADGRPLFGTLTGTIITACTNRIFPQFQNIQMVESVGVSRYDAFTLQLNKRFSRTVQFSANYTLSKATDDSPEQNMTTGLIQGLVASDPTDRSRDRGPSFADQRHTFIMSLVAHPRPAFSNKVLHYIFNHNVIGVVAYANSGETFNILAGADLNRDGVASSDRPVGIGRNSGTTPPQYNLDLRYSRFFDFGERYKLGISGEFQNLFNTNSIVGYNNVGTPTNLTTGELIGPLPDFRGRNQSSFQESRQFQVGIRLVF